MTIDELRERMSGAEFTRWHMYYARKAQAQELAAATAKGR